MQTDLQEQFYALMDRYNSGVEPLESWETADIVALIRILDAVLQQRHDEAAGFLTALQGVEETDYDFDPD